MFNGPRLHLHSTHAEQEGVSDLETGGGEGGAAPTVEDLQAQLKALKTDNEARVKREEQYLAALAGVDTVVRREKPKPVEDDQQEEELDPVVAKKLQAVQAQADQRISGMQDQMDQLGFTQMAASMGISQEDYMETEKQYQGFRSNGVCITDNTGAKRPLTRVDVLDRIFAQRSRGEMMKAAPEKNLASLKTKLVGQASFENTGSYEGAPKLVKLDSELDKAPNKERLTKLDKALSGIEF